MCPLKRAVQTAKIIARVLAMEKKISIWNELLPERNPSELYDKLNQFTRESTILMIGHQQGLCKNIERVCWNYTEAQTK
jgi:phosphohistidine phosphatase SixA